MIEASNIRRCSDALEFACRNGEILRMAFVIDAFDREIIAFAREIWEFAATLISFPASRPSGAQKPTAWPRREDLQARRLCA